MIVQHTGIKLVTYEFVFIARKDVCLINQTLELFVKYIIVTAPGCKFTKISTLLITCNVKLDLNLNVHAIRSVLSDGDPKKHSKSNSHVGGILAFVLK